MLAASAAKVASVAVPAAAANRLAVAAGLAVAVADLVADLGEYQTPTEDIDSEIDALDAEIDLVLAKEGEDLDLEVVEGRKLVAHEALFLRFPLKDREAGLPGCVPGIRRPHPGLGQDLVRILGMPQREQGLGRDGVSRHSHVVRVGGHRAHPLLRPPSIAEDLRTYVQMRVLGRILLIVEVMDQPDGAREVGADAGLLGPRPERVRPGGERDDSHGGHEREIQPDHGSLSSSFDVDKPPEA